MNHPFRHLLLAVAFAAGAFITIGCTTKVEVDENHDHHHRKVEETKHRRDEVRSSDGLNADVEVRTSTSTETKEVTVP